MSTTSVEHVRGYERDLHAQADELERRADTLDCALLAHSLKSKTLRAEAAHLRAMAT
jgi:hypothetical protein